MVGAEHTRLPRAQGSLSAQILIRKGRGWQSGDLGETADHRRLAQKPAVSIRGVQTACPPAGGAVKWSLAPGIKEVKRVPLHGIYLSFLPLCPRHGARNSKEEPAPSIISGRYSPCFSTGPIHWAFLPNRQD